MMLTHDNVVVGGSTANWHQPGTCHLAIRALMTETDNGKV